MPKTVHHKDLQSLWGDEDHLQVAQKRSFTSLIYELLSEKVPTESEEKIFELILNLSIDHGPETPSAVKTIEAAREGKTISESLAAGISEINDRHGGAIEPAMDFLYQLKDGANSQDLVKDYLDNKKIIGGFGHRIYKELDPRAELILETLKKYDLGQEFIDLADQVKQTIAEQKGFILPLNIDGAIAVALCAMGWSSNLGKAVFIIARTPGLCGQYLNATNDRIGGTNE